ncbi:MAG: sigma-70 family RNA polymerase sigma factor [bacterium]
MTVSENIQTIYDKYQPKIRRYLTRLVGEHEAEDLAQEVFMKISQSLQNFRGDAQLSTWIYRIATNTALDRLRSPSFQQRVQKRLSNNSIVKSPKEIEDKNVWTGQRTLSVEQQIVQKEMNVCIRAFVEKLPENYRTVVVLRELEGLKNREIADILGISLDTVKIRLHRARARLKRELESHCSLYRNDENELACDVKSVY